VADIVLITGLSGAGRSGAAAVFEDLGWYVIDNLPTSLVDRIVELASKPASDIKRLALVAGRQHVDLLPKVAALRSDGHRVRILFLDASTPELVKRYDLSRRKHPLDAEAEGLVESIELERHVLDPVHDAADLVIDTTDLNIHQLKTKLLAAFADEDETQRLQVAIESFGYKYGLPLEADLVFDARFLPNPHFVPTLKPKTGKDRAVASYLSRQPSTDVFMSRLTSFLRYVVPHYVTEGKAYLTVAIGCTGGRHRSVYLAERLKRELASLKNVTTRVRHRDIARA
jgi:UPF0042 nucleotide-binding protein